METVRNYLLRLRDSRAALSRDEGATDPILIIAGIAISLILMIGGSFAISGFIANANNMNARGELSRIATAQGAYMSENDEYAALSVGAGITPQNRQLADADLGLTPSNNRIIVTPYRGGWTAVTQSASGDVFLRTSDSLKTVEIDGSTAPAPGSLGPPVLSRTNLATAPNGTYFKSGATPGAGYESGRWGADGVYTNIRDVSDGPEGTGLTSYARWTGGTATSATRGYGFHIASNSEGAVSAGALPVTGGQVITLSSYWRASNSTSANFRVRFHNGTAWVTSQNGGPSSAVSNGEWVRVSYTITVPATATYAAINLLAGPGATPGTTLEATGLLVDVNNGVRSYIDGNTPSADPTIVNAWTGQDNRSTSTQSTRALLNNNTTWTPNGKPDDVELPIGVTWDMVASDLIRVHR